MMWIDVETSTSNGVTTGWTQRGRTTGTVDAVRSNAQATFTGSSPLMVTGEYRLGESIAQAISEPESRQRFTGMIVQAFDNNTNNGGGLLRRTSIPLAVMIALATVSHGQIGQPSSDTAQSRVEIVESQSPAHIESLPHVEALESVKVATGLTQERIGRLLGVTRQALHLWERGEQISDSNRQRLLGVRDVLERAAKVHHTPAQLATWLDTPRGADGRTPAQLLEANEINRARLLAMSTPSPRLVRPPEWVRQPVPELFRTRAEHLQEAVPPVVDDDLPGEADEDI